MLDFLFCRPDLEERFQLGDPSLDNKLKRPQSASNISREPAPSWEDMSTVPELPDLEPISYLLEDNNSEDSDSDSKEEHDGVAEGKAVR